MHFYRKHLTTIIIILIGLTAPAWAQKQSKIQIQNSDLVRIDRKQGPELTKLIGNVYITHANVKMYCDSAYQYQAKNMVEGFGRVHVIQGDTLHMYGDYVRYDGNKRIAEGRNNVKLENRSVILTTEKMDYNMIENVGYYFDGGRIVDSTTVLTSRIGRYYTQEHLFFFKDSVVVEAKDYTLYSDTLKYNTENKTAYILGPTRIVGEKETLYSEDGWYNTQTNISQLIKNTKLESEEYSIKGDSIYLDRVNEIGKLFNNVELKDTVNNLILKGNYLEAYRKTEEALITDSTVFIQVSEGDSLYLHADSMRIEKDTNDFKRIKAYHHVKFFRKDLQGQCDSMVYTLKDSTIRLYHNPILWAQGNQITADTIALETQNNQLKYIHFRGSAFLCSKEDSTKYNQIKGKNMLGHVFRNRLYRLDINGNGETLYYPKDKEEIMGVNIAKSSNITILIKNNKIDQIIFITKPDGNLFPLGEIQPEKRYLRDFQWLEQYQPKSKEDIFFWDPATAVTKPKLPEQKSKEMKMQKDLNKLNRNLKRNFK